LQNEINKLKLEERKARDNFDLKLREMEFFKKMNFKDINKYLLQKDDFYKQRFEEANLQKEAEKVIQEEEKE